MIHLVASGPSVLETWPKATVRRGDVVCAISGAARYVPNSKLDWWVVADKHTPYDPLLDPPNPTKPKRGILADAPSSECFKGAKFSVEVHDHLWPLPKTKRRFSAPCAAIWLLKRYPGPMTCYGVDLCGNMYAWSIGPEVDTRAALIERWEIERAAWAAIVQRYPGRIQGLPEGMIR